MVGVDDQHGRCRRVLYEHMASQKIPGTFFLSHGSSAYSVGMVGWAVCVCFGVAHLLYAFMSFLRGRFFLRNLMSSSCISDLYDLVLRLVS
jgi:hypothetical protein